MCLSSRKSALAESTRLAQATREYETYFLPCQYSTFMEFYAAEIVRVSMRRATSDNARHKIQDTYRRAIKSIDSVQSM